MDLTLLLVLVITLAIFNLVGGAWSIVRELYIRELHQEYSKMAADAITACKDVQHAVQRVGEKISEQNDNDREHRDQIIQQILLIDRSLTKVEQRVESTMRVMQGSVNVITGGTNQSTFGNNHGAQTQNDAIR